MTPATTRAESHYFSPSPPDLSALSLRLFEASLENHTLEFATSAAVFNRSGLDQGSRILLEHLLIPSGAQVCDLGCGWGAIGCFLAARDQTAFISMCDINARAVALARFNATRNQLKNTTAWCGDGLSAVRDESFECIVCNPPVRAGNRVLARLFSDAQRCLVSDGALWIVLRTAQGAKSWQQRLKTQFGNCELVVIDSGYRVFKCVK